MCADSTGPNEGGRKSKQSRMWPERWWSGSLPRSYPRTGLKMVELVGRKRWCANSTGPRERGRESKHCWGGDQSRWRRGQARSDGAPTRPDGKRSRESKCKWSDGQSDGVEDRPKAMVRQLNQTERGVGSRSAVGVVARAIGVEQFAPVMPEDRLEDGGADGVSAMGMSSLARSCSGLA